MKKHPIGPIASCFICALSFVSIDVVAQTKARSASLPAPECRATDFRSFLEWNMRAPTFDKMSVAPTVQVVRGGVRTTKTRAQYKELPIALMDYSYITSRSAKGNPRNWENVRIEINEAQDGRVRVDWVLIRPNRQFDEESISPEAGVPFGPRGYLLFRSTPTCWQVTHDIVGH
jgi:hypothetical protein